MKLQAAGACLMSLVLLTPASAQFIDDPRHEGTYSIIARDPATGELGMGVQSKTVAAASRAPGGKGGVAIFAHQSASNPMYSTVGIGLIQNGLSPKEALDFMLRGDEGRESRQVSIIDMTGRTAAFTGSAASDWKGHECGVDFCAQGNILAGPEVVQAMARSFRSSSGPLAERLLAALDAAQAAGGDRRGSQSAGLLILKPLSIQGFGDRALDLRVDEHKTPLVELRRVLGAYRARELMAEANDRLQRGDLAGALEKALAARDKHPDNDTPWLTIGEVQLRMGRRAEALAALRTAVDLNAANKSQLRRNEGLGALREDPDFLAIVRD